jgi:hypothetical protein
LLAAGGGAWYVQQQQQEHEFELQLAKQQQEHELEVLKKQQEHEFELAKKRQELYAALATRLDEAKRLRDQARAARRVADLEKFTEALLVAEAAQESARAEGFTGDVLKEVADLLAELKDEAAASKRDERLLKGLERFRSGLYALHYAGVGGVFMRTGVAPPGWTDVGSLGERLDPPDPAWRMGIGSQPTPFAPRVGFPGVPAGPWDTLGPMGVQWDIWGRMGVGRQPTPFAPRTGSSVGEDLLRGRSPGAGAAGTEEKTRLALAEKALIEKQGLVDVLGKLFDEWNESLSFYVPPAKGVADRIRQRPGLVVADVKTTLDMYIKGYFRGETKKYPYLRDLASALPDG